jgi:NAD(P)-dependent dehydrogenase (short-subunit alcohol dehydrogenase family)
MEPFSLKGKTILVTGASSGIGAGIAITCSQCGASVIINGRNRERLDKTFSQLEGKNNQILAGDLCHVDEVDNITEKTQILDGIVFCAGIIKTMPVKNITDDAILEIFQTNIFSSIQLLRRLLQKKKIAKGGSIVLISSVSTFNVKVGNSLYSATKGAVNSFAKAMALEVARQRMRVNCIQPGFIPSQILSNSAGIEENEMLQWYKDRHPLGLGEPKDIAYGCVYLLSDASRWVTGSIFTIDGGYTLQ